MRRPLATHQHGPPCRSSGLRAGLAEAIRRGRSLKCRICGQKGATLGCHHSICRHSYHLSCAREGKCLLMVSPH